MYIEAENNVYSLISEIAIQKELNHSLTKEIEKLQLYFNEMEATNKHLIAATWREREIKQQLKETLNELSNTKIVVEKQNQRITESINYSQKIQLAINASENNIKETFPESFILYNPKDIISGDFPWYYRNGNDVFFAAVDCTGHGVPGALLSTIGNLLLNDIIANNPKKKTSEILLSLHQQVIKTLKQNNPDSDSNDGMDIALCKIDLKRQMLYYSGAHRPMLYIKNNEPILIKGDRFPIGGMQYKNKNNYTEHSIQIEKGDSLYIFSDGYPDQTGGEDNRKFSTRKLNELLILLNQLDASKIRMSLENNLKHWMGDNKQVDDVLVMGVKF